MSPQVQNTKSKYLHKNRSPSPNITTSKYQVQIQQYEYINMNGMQCNDTYTLQEEYLQASIIMTREGLYTYRGTQPDIIYVAECATWFNMCHETCNPVRIYVLRRNTIQTYKYECMHDINVNKSISTPNSCHTQTHITITISISYPSSLQDNTQHMRDTVSQSR